jgi:phosphodiesterase/alkaline phosphatase D-like protein
MNVLRHLCAGSTVLIFGCMMSTAHALQLSHGSMAGAVTADSAKIWSRWSGRLVDATQEAGLHNVVFISGDIHSGGAIDDGTHSGVPEVSVPHANMPSTTVNTCCRGSRAGGPTLINEPGTWTIGGLQDPNLQIHPMTCMG